LAFHVIAPVEEINKELPNPFPQQVATDTIETPASYRPLADSYSLDLGTNAGSTSAPSSLSTRENFNV
jgi:hypothetical protein